MFLSSIMRPQSPFLNLLVIVGLSLHMTLSLRLPSESSRPSRLHSKRSGEQILRDLITEREGLQTLDRSPTRGVEEIQLRIGDGSRSGHQAHHPNLGSGGEDGSSDQESVEKSEEGDQEPDDESKDSEDIWSDLNWSTSVSYSDNQRIEALPQFDHEPDLSDTASSTMTSAPRVLQSTASSRRIRQPGRETPQTSDSDLTQNSHQSHPPHRRLRLDEHDLSEGFDSNHDLIRHYWREHAGTS